MSAPPPFLLDANVFIEAKNSYYSFAICPGFWKCLVGHFESGSLFSIDHVRQELLRGNDDLAEWVKSDVPNEFFHETQDADTRKRYQEIMLWVQRNAQFYPMAKAGFAASADGWLIAHAWAKGLVVVTHEQLAPGVKNRVPIPNVCEHFGVRYEDTFFVLRSLKIQFDWKPQEPRVKSLLSTSRRS